MKYIKLVIITALFGITALLVAQRKPDLKKQLFVAFHEEWLLPKLLNTLKRTYSKNPEKIVEILGTQDEQGWNILHHYAGHDHLSGVKEVLEYVKSIYGNNLSQDQLQSIFDLINMRDKDGRNILHLATLRKNPQIIRLIVDFVQSMFDKNPKLIGEFYLVPDNFGWTALHITTENDDFANMRLILHKLQNIMTPEQFKDFINMEDTEGDRPYDYAKPAARKLLRKYGAEITEISDRRFGG